MQKSLHLRSIEYFPFERCVPKQSVMHDVFEIRAEPVIERNAKTRLASLQRLIRQNATQRFFENDLPLPAAQFQCSGNASGEFEQVMIQERGAALEAKMHRAEIH